MTEVADKMGCALSTLSNYLNGTTEAGPDLIKKVAELLKIEPDQVPRRMPAELREGEAPYRAHRVPVVSFARAGDDGFDYEDLANQIDQTVETDVRDPNAFGLIVENDSMEPRIKSGDIAIVAPNESPRNGDLVVARLRRSGGALIKLYHVVGPKADRIRLTSYNSAYPPLEYPSDEFRFIYPILRVTFRTR